MKLKSGDETNENQRRERRQPTWMRDFVSGAGLSEEEEKVEGIEGAAYMVQNVMSDDPTLFEKVVQHAKWRKAMDNEIQSI